MSMDEHGIVMATIPGNIAGGATIAWCSHMDTSPESTAKNVKPSFIRNYDGNDIVLPGDPSQGHPRLPTLRAGGSQGQDAHHDRRHDAARRRRQGGHRRHHGRPRLHLLAHPEIPHGRSASASPAMRRSATASITST